MSFYYPGQVIETYRGGGGRGGGGGGRGGGYGWGGYGRGGYGHKIPLGHYGRHRNYQIYPSYYLPVNYGNYGNFYDTDYTTITSADSLVCLCQDDVLLNNTSMKISCPVADQCGVWYPASSCNNCNPIIPSR